MRITSFASAAVFGSATLLAALSYGTGFGINVPLMAAATLAPVAYLRCHRLAYTSVRIQLVVWAMLAVALVWHFDAWTLTTFSLSSLLTLASLKADSEDPLRAVVHAILIAVTAPVAWSRSVSAAVGRHGPFRQADYGVAAKAAPAVAIASAFGLLYALSNSRLTDELAAALANVFYVDWWWSSASFTMQAIGWSLLAAGALYAAPSFRRVAAQPFGKTPAKDLPRVSGKSVSNWSTVSITLVAVNALALLLNTTDGFTTWFGEVSTSGAELTRGVHLGTYTLITAIVLASGYLIHAFERGVPDAQRARQLGVAWLAQNFVMVLTVALRNYQYTDAYGLTYKRIGVYLFLICASTGLYFLSQQIGGARRLEFAVKRQAWAVFAVLAVAALPNWPALITRYNLSEARAQLDTEYLEGLIPYNIVALRKHAASAQLEAFGGTFWRADLIGDWEVPILDWREWSLNRARFDEAREW